MAAIRPRTIILLGVLGLVLWFFVSLALALRRGRAATELAVVTENQPGDCLGAEVLRLEDLNGDGKAEFLVAAEAQMGFGGGYALVVDGGSLQTIARLPRTGSESTCVPRWHEGLDGGRPRAQLGLLGPTSLIVWDADALLAGEPRRVALKGGAIARDFCWLGDVDGDGTSDVALLSSPPDGQAAPRLTLVSGTDGQEISVVHEIDDQRAFVGAVVVLGDLDGDALPEFGEYRYPGLHTCEGEFIVRSGRDGAERGELRGGCEFGRSATACGDWDGDSVPDFALTEPYDGGRVVVVSGATLKALREFAWPGRRHVSSDIVVPAECITVDSGPGVLVLSHYGMGARLTLLRPNGSEECWGAGPESYYAWSVACLDDADGDGRGEVVVGFANMPWPKEPPEPGFACIVTLTRCTSMWWLD